MIQVYINVQKEDTEGNCTICRNSIPQVFTANARTRRAGQYLTRMFGYISDGSIEEKKMLTVDTESIKDGNK